MDYITLGAICFVAVFAFWGFFRGFWKSFAAIVSLVLAYVVSALTASPLSKILISQFGLTGINEQILWGACGIGVFILVSFTSRLGILLIGKVLPVDNLIINRTSGSLLSAGYGASLAIFIVWAFSFSLETVNQSTGVAKRFDLQTAKDAPLAVQWSRDIMSRLLKWNAETGGASEVVGEVTQAFAKDPTRLLGEVKSAIAAPEFRDMVSNPDLQLLLRNSDFESIKSSPEYQTLIESPSIQHLQSVLIPSGGEDVKNELADHALAFWHDIDVVRNDPEVMLMLQDAELQRFINGSGEVSLSLLTKAKDLLKVVSTKAEGYSSAMPDVYKWYDDNGVIHVTEWNNIPNERRDGAIKVTP